MSRGGIVKVPVRLVKNADFKDIDKVSITFNAAGLPNRRNEAVASAKEVALDLKTPEGEVAVDLNEKAAAGTFTFFVHGEVQAPYQHEPESAKRAEEDKNRIEQVAKEIAEEAKRAEQAHQQAEKDLQQAKQADLSGLTEDARKEAEAKVAAAEEARAKAAGAEKTAKELVQAAERTKKKAQEEARRTAEAAKEKNLRVWIASLPVMVEVVAFPASVTLEPTAVAAPPGGTAEVKVSIAREFGFVDEVKLELHPPKGVDLKLAEAAEVAKDQGEGKLVVATGKDAKPAKHAVTVRALVKFNNRNLTQDFPLEVEVLAPPGP
jgi:hypothetical protein